MTKLLQDHVVRLINKNTFSEEELFVYISLVFAVAFAGSTHVLLLILMLALGIQFLVVLNFVSVCVYITMLVILFKYKNFPVTGIMLAIEVICYTTITSLFVNSGNNIILYYILLMALNLLVPYAKIKTRIILSFFILAALIVSVLYDGQFSVLSSPLTPYANIRISMFNACMCFIGTSTQLFCSNYLRKTIAKINKDLIEKYKNQASTDSLTGLRNRHHAKIFFDNLEKAPQKEQWCMAMLDIDNFKSINDSLGHQAGDDVLASLARILSGNLRKTDIVFRWGGDEFLLLLFDVTLDTAAKVLEKIRICVEQTIFTAMEENVTATTTIGVSQLNVLDINGTIAHCDKQLYWGKENGKNIVVSHNM